MFALHKQKRFFKIDSMPKIIIKVDDLFDDLKPMRKFAKYCLNNNICFCFGIIGQSLEHPSKAYLEWVKSLLSTGMVELFNHGYLHCRPLELCGPSYKEQRKSILKTQNIVKEKLGVVIKTIGTPENAKDDNTLRAVESVDDIDTWFFGHNDYSKCMYPREIYLEKPFPVPSLNHVMDGLIYKKLDTVVFECHPHFWNREEWNTFYNIIDFLKRNNAEFILPHTKTEKGE